MGKRVKQCSKCGKRKLIDKFYKVKENKDGLNGQCKVCISRGNRIRYVKKNPDARKVLNYKENHRTINGTKQKLCPICGIWKPISKFCKMQAAKDSLQYWCKLCAHEQYKEWQCTLKGCLHTHFHNLNNRCLDPASKTHKWYGGRGIQVKFTFDIFYHHVTTDLGYDTAEKLRGLQIHRIDSDGHYESGNIEFLTRAKHRAKHDELRRLQKQVA